MTIDPYVGVNVLAKMQEIGAQQQQMQQAAQQQNMLRQIMQQPDAIDPKSGLPTVSTLAKLSRFNPELGAKLADQISTNQERKASAEHQQSETVTARQKAGLENINQGLEVYDADLSSGGVAPEIAETKLKTGLKAFLDAQPISDDDKARQWAKIGAMNPTELRAFATNGAVRQKQQELAMERSPATMAGKAVVVDKLGNVYDPNSGQKLEVTAPVEKEGTVLTPERAAMEQARLDMSERGLKLREKLAVGSAADLTDDDLRFAGSIVANGQPMPNMGYGAAGAKARAKILHYAAEQATKEAGSPEAAGAGVVVRKDILASDKAALQAATKQEQSVRQFSQTAMGLADKVEGLMDKVAAQGPEFWAKFMQHVKTKALADEDTREFLGYMTDLQSENAKIMAGSTGSVAQVSAHNQDMMSHMLTGDLPLSEIKGGLKAVREGIKMRNASVSDELQRQRAQLRADTSGGGASAAKAAAGELAQPRSKADYDALPSGAHYTKPGDKPGTYRVKP